MSGTTVKRVPKFVKKKKKSLYAISGKKKKTIKRIKINNNFFVIKLVNIHDVN